MPHIADSPAALERCRKEDAAFTQQTAACDLLDRFYTPTRYPEAPVSMPLKADAEAALEAAQQIYDFGRAKIK